MGTSGRCHLVFKRDVALEWRRRIRRNFILKIKSIPIYAFSYKKSYYLTHPWKFFKEIKTAIKNYWHRARYGYAYVDAWNMDEAICDMVANMLLHIKEYGDGYPGVEPYDTPEKWHAHLEEMAAHFRTIRNQEKWMEEHNEYFPEFEKKILHNWSREYTPEQLELRKKYWERERELNEELHKYIKKVFALFAENFYYYWD